MYATKQLHSSKSDLFFFRLSFHDCLPQVAHITSMVVRVFKVPINPKIVFGLNKSLYNSEQNGAKIFDFGQNRNF